MEIMIQPGEIVYVRMTAATIPKGRIKAKILKSVPFVFAASWDGYSPNLSWGSREDRMAINKFGVKEDIVITEIEVLSRHGFRARNKMEATL